jgi:hypothetical protein
LNGEYELEIHVADINAESKDKWTVGTLALWFKQGADSGDNQGIKPEYKSDFIIEHIFSEEEPDKNIVVINFLF